MSLTSQATLQIKDQSSRSQRKLMYLQFKRYNMTRDEFCDFKLGKASQLKPVRAGMAGPPQVAMHSQLSRFIV